MIGIKNQNNKMSRGLYKTDIERIMGKALEKEGIEVTYNFPIRCRFGYILDFAITDLKIDIECDGEKWHPEGNNKDRRRNGYLRSKGWTILRFRGKEIKDNTQSCINKIKETIEKEVNEVR